MLTHCGTKAIETERLLLRPFQVEDNAAVLKNWASDEELQKLYSEPVYQTQEEVAGLLAKYIGGYQNQDYYRWAIVEKNCGQCIGQIAYFLVDSKNHFGEIEYCVGKAFQRRGYCTEAVEAVIAFGFAQVNFHKVQVCHKQGNEASKGVIQKSGFTYEGTLRDYFFLDGSYIGRLYYSMLKNEWACRGGE